MSRRAVKSRAPHSAASLHLEQAMGHARQRPPLGRHWPRLQAQFQEHPHIHSMSMWNISPLATQVAQLLDGHLEPQSVREQR